jgi:hypothetical protein
VLRKLRSSTASLALRRASSLARSKSAVRCAGSLFCLSSDLPCAQGRVPFLEGSWRASLAAARPPRGSRPRCGGGGGGRDPQPGSLTPDEVYAVVAFLFYRNGIIQESDVLDAKTLPKVEMPNRHGFVPEVPVYPPEKKPSWY